MEQEKEDKKAEEEVPECEFCGKAGYWETQTKMKECCKYCDLCKQYKTPDGEWTHGAQQVCHDCQTNVKVVPEVKKRKLRLAVVEDDLRYVD
jgi:hypothetical protein